MRARGSGGGEGGRSLFIPGRSDPALSASPDETATAAGLRPASSGRLSPLAAARRWEGDGTSL
jgi:hypothetical protein